MHGFQWYATVLATEIKFNPPLWVKNGVFGLDLSNFFLLLFWLKHICAIKAVWRALFCEMKYQGFLCLT